MIRAGRQHLVRTIADLAAGRRLSKGTFSNRQLHRAPGHPRPISSEHAKVLLWDGAQTDAYNAGAPIPSLPDLDDDGDLLDRNEAAAAVAVKPSSWDTYKATPALASHMIRVKGVEHWPRGVIRSWKAARPGYAAGTSRPKGAGDLVARDEMHALTGPLLDADPAVTGKAVAEALGVHLQTAQAALGQLRAQRIAEHLRAHSGPSAADVATELGYPAKAVRRAVPLAEAYHRAHRIRPYVESVAEALTAAGTTLAGAPVVRVGDDDQACATLALGPDSPAPALVWHEQYGWFTSPSRRHPLPSKTAGRPPVGEGIRYLGRSLTPKAEEIAAAVHDRRKGTNHPRA
ncbi:DUF6292 family protein [Streptomyces sp. NEAU-S7GS2]|uniref:DUF6292 family protein n=1 Tax=Streptomyces sp. NEAU-S7GS2 TaxID=2202000 RepID=UPI000D6ED454|nr:DUF6292 family protein [Streptomyces sp. NEAU-S7GS2]AWN32631.1 hypothetical protein DKG71_42395 [Streptomyces sp. NEAU-S7GS2]